MTPSTVYDLVSGRNTINRLNAQCIASNVNRGTENENVILAKLQIKDKTFTKPKTNKELRVRYKGIEIFIKGQCDGINSKQELVEIKSHFDSFVQPTVYYSWRYQIVLYLRLFESNK